MKKVYKKRYGRYPIFHLINILPAMVVLRCGYVFFSLEKLTLSLETFACLYFFILGIGCFISFYYPFMEKFYINNNLIYRKKRKNTEQIFIPDCSVFVLSYTVLGFRYYGKYMVNIINEDIETTLKKLHEHDDYNKSEMMFHSRKLYNVAAYSNKMITKFFRDKCVYSFLYEKQFADEFFSLQKKTVIIPLSIYDKIDINPDTYTIIIDEKG